MGRNILRKFILSFLFILLSYGAAWATPHNGAVIISYTRIGEDEYPDESLRTVQFTQQIELLRDNNYNIWPVEKIIASIKNGEDLPDKTIGITFDGAYRSAYEHAIPILIENDIPFTIFFASDLANDGILQTMSWSELKSIKRYRFVDLGIHPAQYARLSDFTDLENRTNINKALSAYRDAFGENPKLFAFPFGEYDKAHLKLMQSYEFDAIFGLQSGAFNTITAGDILPRFAMTERYGNLERFRLVSGALPFNYYDLEPTPPVFKDDWPVMGFSVPVEDAKILEKTRCFVSGQGRAKVMRIGDNRIEIRTPYAVDEDRLRINCTAPQDQEKTYEEPRWHWLGLLLHRADDNDIATTSPQPNAEDPAADINRD